MRLRYTFSFLLLVLFCIPHTATAQTFFTAHLTPAQAGTDVETASGTAGLALTDEGLRFIVTVDGLSGPITNAHFHLGAPGVGGGVVHGIMDDFTANTAIGVWSPDDAQPLDDEAMANLLQGNLYLNIHTDANPGGEIRGQVLPSAGTALSAALTTAQAGTDGTGSGTAAMQLTDAGLIYLVTVADLTGPATNAHFHQGAFGVGGGVVHGIFDNFDGNTAFGLWQPDTDSQPLTDEAIDDLLLGTLYLNVHTDANPGGEIRGQVLPSAGWGFSARLDGAQADTDVDGTGTASMTLTPHGLIYRVTVDGLTGPITNAHFHEGAVGVSGGVVHGIFDNFDGNTAAGVWRPTDAEEPLTADRIADLVQGTLYLNIHTEANPPGEIRGQVLLNEGTSLTAALTTAQAGTDGTGTGTATMTPGDDGLAYQVTVSGLTGAVTNAHFHQGAAGVGGGVVHGIFDTFDGNTASGTWGFSDAEEPLTDEALADLLLGNLYLNIHTDANPGGEIRGQVVPASGSGLQARLTTAQAGIEGTGTGTAAMTLTPHGLIYRVTIADLTGPATNAHFHQGAFGVGGGVVHGIFDNFDGNTAFGLWRPTDDQALTDEAIDDLLLGKLYLNIHTDANSGGEIRGQVVPSDGVGVAMDLSPEQEPHTVVSDGRGAASLTFTDAGVIYGLTVSDLTSDLTNAHFHEGAFGVGGGVVHGIFDTFDGNTAAGVWRPTDAEEPLTADRIAAFVQGNLYLNVHTADFSAGELRGQIRPQAVVVTDVDDPTREIPDRFALEQNYPNPFNPTTTITFALPNTARVSLAVYDVLGRRVATLVDRTMSPGTHTVPFEAADLPSGVYLYRLDTDGFQDTRSMLLVK